MAKEKALISFKELENYLIGTKIKIYKYYISSNKEKIYSFKVTPFKFFIYLKKPITTVKKILELDQNTLLAIIEDKIRVKTIFYVVSEKMTSKIFSLPFVDLIVAKGSNTENVIVVNNSEKFFKIFNAFSMITAFDKKKIKEFGFEGVINSPVYMKKSNSLVFVNENRRIMAYSLSGKFECLKVDLNNFFDNTDYVLEGVLQISSSKCEEKLVILTEKNLFFLDFHNISLINIEIDVQLIKSIQIFEIVASPHILSVTNDSIMLTKFLSKITPEFANEYKKVIGNPIFDILSYSLLGPFSQPVLKTKAIFCYTNSYANIQNIENYYLSLPSISKKIVFSGFWTESQSIDSQICNTFDFLQNLSYFLPSSISTINNFLPMFNSTNRLSMILKQQPNPTLVEYIIQYLFFGYIEDFLQNLPKVSVVSVIGPNYENSKILANKIFNARTEFFQSSEISMVLSETEEKTFLVIVCELPIATLKTDTMKALELITAVSDLILLNINYHQQPNLKLLLNSLLYSQNRIKDSKLYKFHLNVSIFPVENCYNFDNFVKIAPFPMKFSHSAFSCMDSFTFNSEVLLVLKNFLQIPSR